MLLHSRLRVSNEAANTPASKKKQNQQRCHRIINFIEVATTRVTEPTPGEAGPWCKRVAKHLFHIYPNPAVAGYRGLYYAMLVDEEEKSCGARD